MSAVCTPVELDEDDILPSIERDNIMPGPVAHSAYSLDSDTDNEVEEIEY